MEPTDEFPCVDSVPQDQQKSVMECCKEIGFARFRFKVLDGRLWIAALTDSDLTAAKMTGP